MSQRIESQLRDNPEKSYFFAMGAAHLAEKDSVQELLSAKGFKINRVIVSPSVNGLKTPMVEGTNAIVHPSK
mgnify:FL=1